MGLWHLSLSYRFHVISGENQIRKQKRKPDETDERGVSHLEDYHGPIAGIRESNVPSLTTIS